MSNTVEVMIARLEEKFDNSHRSFRAFQDEIKAYNLRMDETINGNGKPGLKSELHVLRELTESHFNQDRWVQGSMLTILIALFGLVGWGVFFK